MILLMKLSYDCTLALWIVHVMEKSICILIRKINNSLNIKFLNKQSEKLTLEDLDIKTSSIMYKMQ